MKTYLAIDIGASSGRHIIGWLEDGEIKTQEIYRFPNGVTKKDGHLIWDMESLMAHVTAGIDIALKSYDQIVSLAADTWGVDYVLLKGNDPVLPVYSYRDQRTEDAIPRVHEILPFEELYRRTGIQFQPFNTIYQLYADMSCGRLDGVTDFLYIPEYIIYRLCGGIAHEYTIATTSGMINALTGQYDEGIIEALKLPRHLFGTVRQPGCTAGTYKGIKCILCASHDTASAVEGIPMEGDQPYISSGTWSLMGVKTPHPIIDSLSMQANFSNEGGVGYNRYQKNIMGMWVVNRLREELCPDMPFSEIMALAEASTFAGTADQNNRIFFSPCSMVSAFSTQLNPPPVSIGDHFRCALNSLAQCYGHTLRELEQNTGRQYDRLYIVGGGARNTFLNSLTEEVAGLRTIALPIEATTLGNLKIQMEADK